MTNTGITVSGTGRTAVTPDIGVLRLAAESTGVSVAEAVRGASDSLVAMRAALRGQQIREADLQTSEVSVHPNHGRSGPRGYIARFGLAAFADAAAKAEQLAGLADRALGPVEEITEHGATGPGPSQCVPWPRRWIWHSRPVSRRSSVMLTIRWSWS